jgi:hypothetical protein
MAEHTTIKRDGGWTIELSNPIGPLTVLDIQPVSLDHTIRWARKEIPSVLALLTELTGVKESELKKLTGQDSDRVFVAFSFIVPQQIKRDFDEGTRPLATPFEDMNDAQRYEELDSQVDEQDARFPKVEGEVQRFKPQQQMLDDTTPDTGGVNIDAPNVMKKVG